MPSFTDHAGRPIVVVTGAGVVTALGVGKEENWENLTAGQSGIRRISRFETEGLRTHIAGTAAFADAKPASGPEMTEEFGSLAMREAVEEANLGSLGDFPGPLFAAVPPNEMEWPQRMELAVAARTDDKCDYYDLLRVAAGGGYAALHERLLFGSVAGRLADAFGTKGAPISLSTACASGATAIQLGVEAIRRGETDAALCVGTDSSINAEAMIRFSLLSALSTQNDPPEEAARPFAKNRDGFVMAEGAGAIVIESLEHAVGRGARILGVIQGCGERADAFHRTRSSPDGKPIIRCIREAIADAGIEPDEIDYINAHGTGTPENDKMECLAATAVFGERVGQVPISSNKSMIGHTLSAAGTVEAVFTLLTLDRGRIPPTINYHVPDPTIPLDVVPNVARAATPRYALSNSFGFGGQNVSLVLAREPA